MTETTEQENTSTTEQVGNNTKGVGGFGDNPQNINKGGRPKNDQRLGYWLQFFKNLSEEAFKGYSAVGDKLFVKFEKEMFMAELIAYQRVQNSREDLAEYKDMADRTEGRPKQTFEHEGSVVENVSVRIIKDAAELEVDSSLSEELPEPKENNS